MSAEGLGHYNSRTMIGVLIAAAFLGTSILHAQQMHGMSTRGLKPTPRGKPSGLPFHAKFSDVARQAGLRDPVIYGGVDGRDYVLEAIGCGAAFFDYDNDGWIDVFLPSGTRLDGDPEGAENRLYRNNRDGTFVDVTSQSGLSRTGWASAVTTGDYDNDGDEDLFVSYFPQNVLYRNNSDGTFTDVTASAGLIEKESRWGAGCTFLDYDLDGHLDLFVSNYLKFDFDSTPKKGGANCNWKGVMVHCGPRGLPEASHYLYRNAGDGTYVDVSEETGISAADPGYGLTVVSTDFTGDGWPDIYVACDSTPSLLFVNNQDGTFSEEGMPRGVALSDDGMEQAGMGVGVGDFNLDGKLDILKTHFSGDTAVLYRGIGNGDFEDVTLPTGLGVETRFVSWGANIVDLDNNGFPDLFWVTGDVYPELEKKLPNLPLRTPRVLFRNLGQGRFEQLFDLGGPAISAAHCSRGAAFGDYDNDGDIDILIVNLNEPPSLLRNDLKGGGNWVKVKLRGVRSNGSALGAVVTVKYGDLSQAGAALGQSSFYSVNDRRLHFGVGEARNVDIRVRWPGGRTDDFSAVEVNQLVSILEGSGISSAERLRPAQSPAQAISSDE